MASHPGERRMYDSKRKKFYWPYTVSYVYTAARVLFSCAQNSEHGNKQNQLKQYFPDGPPRYVRTDLLASLSKTKQDNQ